MKKASILVSALILLSFVSFFVILHLRISSYIPRFLKDFSLYAQAEILLQNSKELAPYFLYQAQNQGKQCLNFVKLNYPNANDTIMIEYFYPLADCENFILKNNNEDANLSKDNIIITHISVLLNANNAVNEEVFLDDIFMLYPK